MGGEVGEEVARSSGGMMGKRSPWEKDCHWLMSPCVAISSTL